MQNFSITVHTRETREECPLLTVETESDGDLKSTNDFGPVLAALVGPVPKKMFPYRTLFKFISPNRTGQAIVPDRLTLCVSAWYISKYYTAK